MVQHDCSTAASTAPSSESAQEVVPDELEARGLDARGLEARAIKALGLLGHEAYEHQRRTFRAQEAGRDVLLCTGTGSGKSAGYQAAAYAMPGTLTVVVQPLVELIFEQTEHTHACLAKLELQHGWARGHACCGRHTGTRKPEVATEAESPAVNDAVLDAPVLRPGTLAYAIVHDADLRVIYLTPEELASKEGGRWTASSAALQWALVHCKWPLRSWVFDEVHLVDRWGSTFRDAYMHVVEACASVDARRRAHQPHQAIKVAATATLTRSQQARLQELVGLREFETICGGNHARINLHLAVRHATTSELAGGSEANTACAALRDVLGGMLPAAALRGQVMLYVSYARSAPIVANAINAAGFHADGQIITAVAYSGDLAPEERRSALDAWGGERSSVRILVTTCAAGTGMDPRREVTLVVHARLPPSLLDLWQEWGRAGRRGSDAWCVLCMSPAFVGQTLHFASERPVSVRERLVQELVEVIALAMQPGCRRRLLDGMVSTELPISRCSACDACCPSGVCGAWEAAAMDSDETQAATALLEWLEQSRAEAPTLAQLVNAPAVVVGLPSERVLRVRLVLRLVGDGAIRFEWERLAWRLRCNISTLRAFSLGHQRLCLSLPISLVRCGPADPTDSEAQQAEALARLHKACVEESSAKKRQLLAVQEYCLAGGDLFSDAYCAAAKARHE